VIEVTSTAYRQLAQGTALTGRGGSGEPRACAESRVQGSCGKGRRRARQGWRPILGQKHRCDGPMPAPLLQLQARSATAPGDAGILKLGAGDRMEAVAEVYES